MLQLVISGLVMGSILALLAMSFNIIFRISQVINFAQGDLMMLAAMLVFSAAGTWHLGVVPGVLLALVTVAFTAVLIDVVSVRSVWRFGGRESHNWVLTTFGVSVLIQNLALLVWGRFDLGAPKIFGSEFFYFWGVGVSSQELGILAAALVIVLAVDFSNERTLLGRAAEATAEKPKIAELMGINTSAMITYAWIVAALVAGVAGILVAPLLVLNAFMGWFVGIKAFAAMIIGGLGSARGSIVAGYGIGVYEALVSYWVPGGYVDALTLLLVIIILYFRPQGAFGRAKVDRA
jgi:branched-chain amino acid transport system permease protein